MSEKPIKIFEEPDMIKCYYKKTIKDTYICQIIYEQETIEHPQYEEIEVESVFIYPEETNNIKGITATNIFGWFGVSFKEGAKCKLLNIRNTPYKKLECE